MWLFGRRREFEVMDNVYRPGEPRVKSDGKVEIWDRGEVGIDAVLFDFGRYDDAIHAPLPFVRAFWE